MNRRMQRHRFSHAAALAFVLSAAAGMAFSADEGYKSQDVRPVKQDPAPAPAHAQAVESEKSDAGDSSNEEGPVVLKGDLDFTDLELITIQENGRKKPLQTYAHEQIEQLVGRPIFSSTPYLKEPGTGDKIYSMDLLLSIWFDTRNWQKEPVILVADAQLREAVGLPRTENHFSVETLSKCTKLSDLISSGRAKRDENKAKEMTSLEKEAEIIQQRLFILYSIMRGDERFAIIPHPKSENGAWISLETLSASFKKLDEAPYYTENEAKNVFLKYLDLRKAYRSRNAQAFSAASKEFRATLANLSPRVYPASEVMEREVGFNKLRPFGRAWIFYFFAVCIGLLAVKFEKNKLLYWGLMGTYAFGLFFQVYGFGLRCIIAGRPPVSNMYESVIWVGFGAVFFGLIFELIYRRGYFALSGAFAGFLCLVMMDLLPVYWGNAAMPGFESALSPLQPVLRDNYWLTVHVLTITLSYAAFMLTCVLGHVTLWKHLVNPGAKFEHRELHQFVYRGIQVGVLLLACGTILGGAWAYKSWGRFWGWDPKETWAFIALMCSLVVLHGRFAGWWGNFGMSVGSVFCFWPIVMAWYGVNFVLGSGMHAYGSGAGGKEYVVGAAVLDVIFTTAAIVRFWTYKEKKDDEKGSDGGEAELPGKIEKLSPSDPVVEVRQIAQATGAGE